MIEKAVHALVESGHCTHRSFEEFALQHNTSAKYLQRRIPQAYDILVAYLASMRVKRAEIRKSIVDERARKVVQSLISTGQKCSAYAIARSLSAARLSMACPVTRFAVNDELGRVRPLSQKMGIEK